MSSQQPDPTTADADAAAPVSPPVQAPALPGLLSIQGLRLRLRARAGPRLLLAALARRYRYHGIDTAVLTAAALFYALHPDDALHHLLEHLGVGDDLLVLGLAGRWINNDLEDFLYWEHRQWQLGQPTGPARHDAPD